MTDTERQKLDKLREKYAQSGGAYLARLANKYGDAAIMKWMKEHPDDDRQA